MSQYKSEQLAHDFENCVVIHSDGELSSHLPVERYPFGISRHEMNFEYEPAEDQSMYMGQVYSSEIIDFEGLTASVCVHIIYFKL